ncbi:MAG: hypothetical protein BM555_06010 [Crocinitomix sp. MedPE-SWsnd]|nr:MAG: hypothetical protein BM555_06010 [Crocinitomix sp. MedPE-SWsnd]
MMKALVFIFLFCSFTASAQEDSLHIYVPRHFSPWDCDGGTPDGFHVFTDMEYKNYHLILFNRWGEVMFETTDQDAYWEPKDEKGEYLDDAVYVWQITYTKSTDLDFDGVLEFTEEKIKGHTYCLN